MVCKNRAVGKLFYVLFFPNQSIHSGDNGYNSYTLHFNYTERTVGSPFSNSH